MGNVHQTEIGDDFAAMGYPDDGNGRYMQMKPFADWYFINISKRLHRNDFEHLVTVVPLSLINGVVFPWTTVGLLGVYFAGRVIYTQGYQ
jgi:hypothetical protein